MAPFNPNGSEKRKKKRKHKKTSTMIGYDRFLLPIAIEPPLKTERSDQKETNEPADDGDVNQPQLNTQPSEIYLPPQDQSIDDFTNYVEFRNDQISEVASPAYPAKVCSHESTQVRKQIE